jgi:hypothetical protein
MLLPPEYAWFEPVLLAAIIVFIIDVIGSTIVFSSRPVLNALASAIVFAIIFGFLVYYCYGKVVNDTHSQMHRHSRLLPHQRRRLSEPRGTLAA